MGMGAWNRPAQRSWRDGLCAEDTRGPEAAQVQVHLGPSGAAQAWGLRVGGVCLEGDELIGRAAAPSPLAGPQSCRGTNCTGQSPRSPPSRGGTLENRVPGSAAPTQGGSFGISNSVLLPFPLVPIPPTSCCGGQLKRHPGQAGGDIYTIYISQCLWEGRSLTLMVTK